MGMNKLLYFLVLPYIVLSTTGCCMLMHGRFQEVSVTTEPSDAFVKASNGQEFKTPGRLTLDRSLASHKLHIKKEGHKAVDITLKRTLDGWILSNFLGTNILGISVDFLTGCAYAVTPPEVKVTLEKEE